MTVNEETKQAIERDVKSHKVFLYMKGTPETPMCGFSAKVIDILRKHGATFGSKNVLDDDNLRQGIKTYANWPTIPQLYVNGEFVGGCDIIAELDQRGELHTLLNP